jgi:hypothetical protein
MPPARTGQDFDSFRRQRIRSQGRLGADGDSSYDNAALRELEQVEAREVRDQQLTREVHEFFAAATKQAATIVERMATNAEAQTEQRITGEMESFLLDAFSRMNSLVVAMLHKRRGNGGEESVEPNMNNIVGKVLDSFRHEGTAGLQDKHIGEDPFALDLDEVRRQLLDSIAQAVPAEPPAATPIAEHLVAEVIDEPAGEAVQEGRPEQPWTNANDDLERFREALRSLVRQGTMSREEARAAWTTRLQSLGLH